MKNSNHKPGRPPLGPEKKAKKITVALDEEEYSRVKYRAAKSGTGPAVYIRKACLSATVVARLTPQENSLLKNLYKVGTNLNQIAAKLNSGGDYRYDTDLRDILTEFRKILGHFREVQNR